jgi:SAM-dependent methyltransferase
MPSSDPKAGAPVLDLIEWTHNPNPDDQSGSCPTCGNASPKRALLSTPWPSTGGQTYKSTLYQCDTCGCGYFHPASPADYATDPRGVAASLSFYVQQGAGIAGITSNIAELGLPTGIKFLEVGCGFGFGLDFARRTLGWDVTGMDPSPFAAAGRTALNLPIHSQYLITGDPTFDGQFDAVMASEVTEHVPAPLDFMRTLHAAMRDGGTLVLTTPDLGGVSPETPPALLVPLLSIGYHLVLQSKTSLEYLLRHAGFSNIAVTHLGGTSLRATCSRGTARAATNAPADRTQYRNYLRDAAQATRAEPDLWMGLTARAYREAVAAADLSAADQLWQEFATACRQRFGAEPADLAKRQAPANEQLDAIVAKEPLCLGPVLLHRAYHLLHLGAGRTAAEPAFNGAVAACGHLRRTLQAIGADDGDAEDAAWVAAAESLLCAAERGAKDVPERFAALGRAPGDYGTDRDGHTGQTITYGHRLFVSLVNAGRLDDADRMTGIVPPIEARAAQKGTSLTNIEIDVLSCAVARELQRPHPDIAGRALALLQCLHTAAENASTETRPDGDLVFSLIARAYRAAVSTANPATADLFWDNFSAACRRRFGADPTALAQRKVKQPEPLHLLNTRQPPSLGPLMLHRAYHLLLTGADRTQTEPVFAAAADTCNRLRKALQDTGTDDADAQDAAWVATAESLLCAAERAATGLPERFDALGPAPTDDPAQPTRTSSFRRRLYVSLVNAACLDEADRLAIVVTQAEATAAQPGTLLSDGELDVLYCAAARELQRRDSIDPQRALDLLESLRVASENALAAGRTGSAASLRAPARDAKILALEASGRFDDADALRPSATNPTAGA